MYDTCGMHYDLSTGLGVVIVDEYLLRGVCIHI